MHVVVARLLLPVSVGHYSGTKNHLSKKKTVNLGPILETFGQNVTHPRYFSPSFHTSEQTSVGLELLASDISDCPFLVRYNVMCLKLSPIARPK